MRIKEVIVVEGKDDTSKIKQAVDADTIETNGSAINEYIIQQIKHAQEKRGVIIFTDPDFPGERIRHIVSQAVPGCKHAFLTKQEAKAKRDKGIGIEHASTAVIQEALSQVYEIAGAYEPEITREEILAYGLMGGSEAKERRRKLGVRLRIGYANAKQLEKRLTSFQITKQAFEEAMQQILEEEES
ncbi:ribonuclease M5 (plasmid) [Radiobacillus kanasensis]|uniref:ribonuclease M5 n=1 Tax=Radiobacillus kanasensis TaxID=2844358 RepID=UPI001E376D6F|nr:ribonuclease M5 [Radiobacillus kanasensis]UFU01512.1 ribonuclease M5 [Radiobacillus kanasensis]